MIIHDNTAMNPKLRDGGKNCYKIAKGHEDADISRIQEEEGKARSGRIRSPFPNMAIPKASRARLLTARHAHVVCSSARYPHAADFITHPRPPTKAASY